MPSLAPSSPSFLADEHLGRLARYLRAAGIDVASPPPGPSPMDDREILERAVREGRVLLTCDRELAALAARRPHPDPLPGGEGERAHLVRASAPRAQLVEVLRAFRIDPLGAAAFTRCLVCNDPLEPISREAAAPRVPARSLAACADAEDFHLCGRCDRVYWPGSHFRRLKSALAAVRGELALGEPSA